MNLLDVRRLRNGWTPASPDPVAREDVAASTLVLDVLRVGFPFENLIDVESRLHQLRTCS